MQSHEFSGLAKRRMKRIGRGGKRGTTSGRGTKGQGAHGKKKSPLHEGGRSSLIKRLKKVRGFKSPHAKPYTVTLRMLERSYEDGSEVTLLSLIEKGLVRDDAGKCGVKIVSTGTLSKKLSLASGIAVSVGAEQIIVKNGGKKAE